MICDLLFCQQPVVDRDCHGFGKPAGNCPGLVWGTGTGWVYPTLTLPVPQQRVGGSARTLKLRPKKTSVGAFDFHRFQLRCAAAQNQVNNIPIICIQPVANRFTAKFVCCHCSSVPAHTFPKTTTLPLPSNEGCRHCFLVLKDPRQA